MSVYKLKGVGGELEVFDDKLTIAPKGVLGMMNKGLTARGRSTDS